METGSLLKRRSVLAASLLALVLLVWWWHPTALTRPLQSVLATVTYPFQVVLSWAAFEIRDIGLLASSVRHLKDENARLLSENIRLKSDIARLNSLAPENDSLRRLLDLRTAERGDIVMAEVVGRAQGVPVSLVTVNRGSWHGLAVGQPVVAEQAVLIGVVASVGPATATVRLLTDTESLVAGSIASTDSRGVVRGDHGLGMIFDLALDREAVVAGEVVVTAGVGDEMPPGLLVGTIEEVRPSADRLFQQAVVVSPITFDRLRFVGILRNQ